MKPRTKARQIALQFLYQYDLRGGEILNQKSVFITDNAGNHEEESYALMLIEGCIKNWQELGEKISEVTTNWSLERMATIDRNVLRLALYELSYCHDVPAKVVINEAIELGKNYSTQNSGSFINGVMDKLATKKHRRRG